MTHKYWILVTMATPKQTLHQLIITPIQKQAGVPGFSYLPRSSLLVCSLTCRRLNMIATDPSLCKYQ